VEAKQKAMGEKFPKKMQLRIPNVSEISDSRIRQVRKCFKRD
jgi:hypothetical protein